MKNKIANLIEEFIIKNNHCNCDVGYSYAELHVQSGDEKGVANAIARHLVANGIGDLSVKSDVAEAEKNVYDTALCCACNEISKDSEGIMRMIIFHDLRNKFIMQAKELLTMKQAERILNEEEK